LFTINDFIKLLKYYKDKTDTNLDLNLIIFAEHAKATTTTLFNDNLDLMVHSSDDYKRIKEVLIRWYASLKTFNDIMKESSDIRSLPEDQLNTLFNSFGFTDLLLDITHKNKIDFFYDLINLYKIKGTPESITRVLGYFGLSDVDLIEYWLQYNNKGILIFKPERIKRSKGGLDIQLKDLNFSQISSLDPHWILTKEQINQLFLENTISFPSKTPYFSIRPVTQLSGNPTNTMLNVLQRIIQDQYQDFLLGTESPKNIYIDEIIGNISLLDLYLGVVYLFNLLYSKNVDSTDLHFSCFDGSMNLPNEEIFNLYDDILSRKNVRTREELEINKLQLMNLFTRPRTSNFLTNLNSAGDVLTLINPFFKHEIETYSIMKFKLLIIKLSKWVSEYISPSSSGLSNIVFGFDEIEKLKKVINFFKPYRSRLLGIEHAYTIKNLILDSIIPSDIFLDNIIDTVIDFDTSDGLPSFSETKDDNSPRLYYSRNTYDNESYFDIGSSSDFPPAEQKIDIEQIEHEKYNIHKAEQNNNNYNYKLNNIEEVIEVNLNGGWPDFDSSYFFDSSAFSDVCKIYVTNI